MLIQKQDGKYEARWTFGDVEYIGIGKNVSEAIGDILKKFRLCSKCGNITFKA